MVNRRYKVVVKGFDLTFDLAIVGSPEEALQIAGKYTPLSILNKDRESYVRHLLAGGNLDLSSRVRIVPTKGQKSYEQQELDSLGIGEDLIIRVQLSYNGKATKHLNITKEQFDAISKIIVEEK